MSGGMRVARITGPGAVDVVDRPVPAAAGDIVLIKVLVTPMCTEFKQRRDGLATDNLGHEAVGVVVDPAGSRRVRAGDRVVVMPGAACGQCWSCRQGDHIFCRRQRDLLAETGSAAGTAAYAQYVLKPDYLLLPVPDDISLQHAALAICGLGPGFTAAERTRVSGLDTLLVSGAGPVGLGAAVNGLVRGARVLMLEPAEYRAKLARALGVQTVLDPRNADTVGQVAELTGGRGADCAAETSGAPGAQAALLSALRPLGRMALVAWGAPVALPPLVPTGAEVHGCWHWNHDQHGPAMWELIRRAGRSLDVMVTHELPLEAVATAMDRQVSGECGKVLLLPWGEKEPA